jgi:NAD(P)-dependent dehydrogenase (short-subunit alcohol dehydrogenase family)
VKGKAESPSPSPSLQGKVAVLTGAGSGIGKAIAEAFVQNGARLALCDISSERLEQVSAALAARTDLYTAIVDVADHVAVEAFVREGARRLGRLDVMVNNAGVFDGYAGIAETTPELWHRVIDINLTGCFNGCKAAFALMAPQRAGRIINMSSVAAFRGAADGIAYTASKAGIVGLTRRLAVDAGPFGITVNAICPGVVQTDIRRNSAEVLGEVAPSMGRGIGMSPDVMKFLIPLGRGGLPEEVGRLAVFLAGDESAYITGQALSIDGGWTAT